MPRASAGPFVSHWSKYIPSFQTSSQAFYEAVEQSLRMREIPGAEVSRVDWKEGGVLTARREYLRVTRGKHVFDICAAPFGSGFFFSWWLAKVSPMALLYAAIAFMGSVTVMWLLMRTFGLLLGLFLTIIVLPGAFLVIGKLAQTGVLAIEDELLAVPWIGPLYNWLFNPQSYYKLDTMLMFREAVRYSVEEVLDGLLTSNGLRGLTELERKPVMEQLAAR